MPTSPGSVWFSIVPTAQLLPILTSMVAARTLARHPAIVALKPTEMPARDLILTSASAEPSGGGGTNAVLLIVARYQEDVSWLQQLPTGADYHLLQKDALQPELPAHRQTLLPNVGRESHSYLSHLCRLHHLLTQQGTATASEASEAEARQRVAAEGMTIDPTVADVPQGASPQRSATNAAVDAANATDADAVDDKYNGGKGRNGSDDESPAAVPPLIICTQANPFDHNAHFLQEVTELVRSVSSSSTSAPPPAFTPLGMWSGGERLIYCDASGAPHQPKLLPIEHTWRLLFGVPSSTARLPYSHLPQLPGLRLIHCLPVVTCLRDAPPPAGLQVHSGRCHFGLGSRPERSLQSADRRCATRRPACCGQLWVPRAGSATVWTRLRAMSSSDCGDTSLCGMAMMVERGQLSSWPPRKPLP